MEPLALTPCSLVENPSLSASSDTASTVMQVAHELAAKACEGFSPDLYHPERLLQTALPRLQVGLSRPHIRKVLTDAAVEQISTAAPDWQYIAARLLLHGAYEEAAANRGLPHPGYGDFCGLIRDLVARGFYGSYMLEHFTEDEIVELGRAIVPERDGLFTYSGAKLILDRYVVRGHNGEILELPQEMFMSIAMYLASVEPTAAQRMYWARRYYDLTSQLKFTLATPIMTSARRPAPQLSSCFVDTVEDSLTGIYHSITSFAQVSKNGGGMGLYFGKVRAKGSDIRGFKGLSHGVIPWIRLANDTAVSVDQLGTRQGAVSVWLDLWHADLLDFLKLRTNSGDERAKARDVFAGVCVPDLFWKLAGEDLDAPWYLFDPHEVRQKLGFALEDYWGEEWEERYSQCVRHPALSRKEVKVRDILKLMLSSQIESGTPFVLNRDTANRMNPNKHCGIIRSSNLCTEILQNMSAAQVEGSTIQEGKIVTTVVPGDFVVCNLSSLVLSRVYDEELETVIAAQIRAMDAVITLNTYPVPAAQMTSQKYRAVGLGTSGYHERLVQEGIPWESPEHLAFADRLYGRIAFCAIKASLELAKERGPYPAFPGSEWQTGAYFTRRGYAGQEWEWLRREVMEHGVRNGWLMAVAPNSSTATIAGTTPSIDPIMAQYYLEEKKNSVVPQIVPGLNERTASLYKEAHAIDQMWSVRAAAVRQRHIDQGQSFNLYINPSTLTLRQLFTLYYEAWRLGVKTVYYVRSRSLESAECQSCAV